MRPGHNITIGTVGTRANYFSKTFLFYSQNENNIRTGFYRKYTYFHMRTYKFVRVP